MHHQQSKVAKPFRIPSKKNHIKQIGMLPITPLRDRMIHFDPLRRPDILIFDLFRDLVLLHPFLDALHQTLQSLVVLVQLRFRESLRQSTAFTTAIALLSSRPRAVNTNVHTHSDEFQCRRKGIRWRTLGIRPRLNDAFTSSWLFLWMGEDAGPNTGGARACVRRQDISAQNEHMQIVSGTHPH